MQRDHRDQEQPTVSPHERPNPPEEREPASKAAAQRPRKKSVVVLYNHVGEDPYEKLKAVDPEKLGFKPQYPIHVASVKEEYEAVAKALRRAGYRARAVNLENDLKKLERLLGRSRPDVVFNLVEFFHDDAELETAVAAVFDLYRIPYTGSPPFALGLCMRKALTKRVLQDHGVPTPRFKVLYEPGLPERLGLRFPVIVKPEWEDASTGVHRDSVIRDPELLAGRVEFMFREYEAVLIEEFIEGRELHVAVWGNDRPEMLPPVEFDFSKLPPDYPPIISFAVKWNPLDEVYHQVHTVCPAPLSKRVLRRVEQVAIAAYEATECCDYARLDIRLQGNRPYVLEVNPNPDLTEGVSFMDSAERAGYTFPQALARIVEFATERKPKHEPPKPKLEQGAKSEVDVQQLSVMLDPAGQAEKAPSLPDIIRPLLHEGPLGQPPEEAGQGY
jgi:D-alanine-D-alanine ligase